MFEGLLVLCIAGTTQADLPGTVCIEYKSPPFEKVVKCEAAVKRILKSEDLKLLTTLPEYDLELVKAECRKIKNEKAEDKKSSGKGS
jgi:hypothetical protein